MRGHLPESLTPYQRKGSSALSSAARPLGDGAPQFYGGKPSWWSILNSPDPLRSLTVNLSARESRGRESAAFVE
jgi:hypothetical protein